MAAHKRGRVLFWTLVALNAFVIFAFLVPQNHQEDQYSPETEQCFRECLFDAVPNVETLVNTEPQNETEKTTQVTTVPPKTATEFVSVAPVVNPTPSSTESHPWMSCPVPGQGRFSTFITSYVDGRMGNVVWNYLSLWASSVRHGLRPILNKSSIDFMLKVFDPSAMTVPTTEFIDEKCGLDNMLTNWYQNGSKGIGSRNELFRYLEQTPNEGYEMLKYHFYIVNTEELVPLWNQLGKDLVIKKEYRDLAQLKLHHYTELQTKRMLSRKIVMEDVTFQYVGVHVRRTDYEHHMGAIFPGSDIAGPEFFLRAMAWMQTMVNSPLIFVMVSDDSKWTHDNVASLHSNAFLGGNGDAENPGPDLALLAACNHTIFAYGTFGLTGALLSSHPGSFVVVFDPLNGTVTKEMEFAANLPGWRIMDQKGNFNFENRQIDYAYYVHPRIS